MNCGSAEFSANYNLTKPKEDTVPPENSVQPTAKSYRQPNRRLNQLAARVSLMSSLPRRVRCRQNFADAHVSHLFSEVMAEDSIAVAQQVARELDKRKCLPQLRSRPNASLDD